MTSLPNPLPAEMFTRLAANDVVPVVVLAVGVLEGSLSALVVSREGKLDWVLMALLRVKFPPDGPYRLLFGWAEKGYS